MPINSKFIENEDVLIYITDKEYKLKLYLYIVLYSTLLNIPFQNGKDVLNQNLSDLESLNSAINIILLIRLIANVIFPFIFQDPLKRRKLNLSNFGMVDFVHIYPKFSNKSDFIFYLFIS